jgi:tetratricopeptide (TPR) repeat protein
MPVLLASLALDTAALGRLDDAEVQIQQARQVLSRSQERLDFPQEVAYAEGQVFLAMGKAPEALETAKNLAEMAEATGTSLNWRAPARMLWAAAAAALGDLEGAVSTYVGAAEEAERLRRLPLLWRTLAGLAEVQHALGKSDHAAASARQAREIIDRLGATVPDERLRATFLQSSRVQRVMSLTGA